MSRHRTPQLDRLALFVAAAESMSFTATAERLGITKSLVSQQIAKLEAELGGPLFVRTTRCVTLTEAGQRLCNQCTPLLRDLSAAIDRFGGDNIHPSGVLRITAPPDYTAGVFGAALAEFAHLHPQLGVDLIASDEILDLVGRRIDLAIRIGWLRDSSLRAVKLGEFSQYVVASPGYLAGSSVPSRPEQLAAHRWIALRRLRSPLSWEFNTTDGQRRRVKMQPGIRANAVEAVLGLVRGGAGISVLTDFSVAADLHNGTLRRLLPDWYLPQGGIHVVYPAGRQPSVKVRAFVDFFREWLSNR